MKKIFICALAGGFSLTACEMDCRACGNNRFRIEGATCSLNHAVCSPCPLLNTLKNVINLQEDLNHWNNYFT